MKILFITKRRLDSGGQSHNQGSWGLLNSARMVVNALVAQSIDANIMDVVDANEIDKWVCLYRPDVVICEALWVSPEKFDELKRRHPRVRWVVRIHSKVLFLAHEGIAIDYIRRYIGRAEVGFNDNLTAGKFKLVFPKLVTPYLPNIYFREPVKHRRRERDPKAIAISCFGAIRPLKNQLLQAMAAQVYARETQRRLYFHINATRVEQGGESVLKNLRSLFRDPEATLVEHGWKGHEDFCELFYDIDIAMQVSLSETFNITTADAVHAGVPVVVSDEIPFVSERNHADPRSLKSMVKALHAALHAAETWEGRRLNHGLLMSWNDRALKVWLKFLR